MMDPRYRMADYEWLLRDTQENGTAAEALTALENLIAYCAKIYRRRPYPPK